MNKTKKIHKKPFYHKFISVDRLYVQIKKIGLAPKEEKEVWDLVESTIHTRTIDAILEKLPAEKHETFLEKFADQPDDETIVQFLKKETTDIDVHLEKTFKDLEIELIADILSS